MNDNQFYRLNPNNIPYNQQNYPGRFEVVIQGSEMSQYSPPPYVNIRLLNIFNRETITNPQQPTQMKAIAAH
jgi:hypothetical protein